MTQDYSQKERNLISLKAIFFSFIVLTLFALIGEFIFSFYNITIHSFRIAGGLLLFKISLDMVESKRSRTKTTPKEEKEAEEKEAIAFTPLAIPLIAGPGSIATIMILASESKNNNDNFAIFFALAIVLFITLLIFRISDILSNRLGRSGLRIMKRLMGLILMVISIEFILKGVKDSILSWGIL
tara:strand:+ start:1200 stop:1751 length:552 start_codon:yes stop_codon:yes gene_type:complete